jgi:hypothetical protein
MMDEPKPPAKNRRAFRRRPPRGKAKIACFKGTMDVGPNLSVSLLDISESGVRLIVKSALDKGQDVTMTLEGIGHSRPIKASGKVVWSLQTSDGNYCVGIQLDKYLPYQDITRLA